jgi:hypothetical protein
MASGVVSSLVVVILVGYGRLGMRRHYKFHKKIALCGHDGVSLKASFFLLSRREWKVTSTLSLILDDAVEVTCRLAEEGEKVDLKAKILVR